MTLVQLRKSGPLVDRPKERIERPFSEANEPPRALRSLAKIIEGGLCHRCGSCVGICPTRVLSLDDEDFPVVDNLSACTDCDWCVKVCPGDEFDANAFNLKLFNEPQDLNDVHGHFEKAYLAHANDPQVRGYSASGGAVTGILTSLLERGVIDGAAVIASDPNTPWKGLPKIARTVEDVHGGMKSKYAISPTNVLFEEIARNEGRYALVGLPCQIHGFHKAAELDRRIRDRVVVTIGLFCHAATEHDPVRYVWDTVKSRGKKPVKYLPRVGKHPGEPIVVFEDGSSEPAYFPNKLNYRPSSTEMLNIFYRLYTPERCLTCYDSTSEFADISVGDPWMTPPKGINFYDGYSFVMARTERALEVLSDVEGAGALKLIELDRESSKQCNRATAKEKRHRAFRIIETRKRQGFPIPEYGIEIPKLSGLQFVKTELNMLTHILCYMPRWRKGVLNFIFSPAGYVLIWLNHQRRVVRFAVRDFYVRLKRKLFGIEVLTESENS